MPRRRGAGGALCKGQRRPTEEPGKSTSAVGRTRPAGWSRFAQVRFARAGRRSCRAELQGLVTMEAMAAGNPVVAADAMALPHLVHPGRNGYLFPPGDVRALADRLMELLDDPAARRRMGEADRGIVAGHDIHRRLAAFEALYLHAAGHPAAMTALHLPLPTSAATNDDGKRAR
ncbi:glycosyltransferase [Streptomyces sp. NPDC048825]|uniref:glycosyltransferase n=1 Tax=Streptomyces sp. NPDC048825 TaxID=3365592 RepID=UPI0037199DA7